jgi:hypothetical protein
VPTVQLALDHRATLVLILNLDLEGRLDGPGRISSAEAVLGVLTTSAILPTLQADSLQAGTQVHVAWRVIGRTMKQGYSLECF